MRHHIGATGILRMERYAQQRSLLRPHQLGANQRPRQRPAPRSIGAVTKIRRTQESPLREAIESPPGRYVAERKTTPLNCRAAGRSEKPGRRDEAVQRPAERSKRVDTM